MATRRFYLLENPSAGHIVRFEGLLLFFPIFPKIVLGVYTTGSTTIISLYMPFVGSFLNTAGRATKWATELCFRSS